MTFLLAVGKKVSPERYANLRVVCAQKGLRNALARGVHTNMSHEYATSIDERDAARAVPLPDDDWHQSLVPAVRICDDFITANRSALRRLIALLSNLARQTHSLRRRKFNNVQGLFYISQPPDQFPLSDRRMRWNEREGGLFIIWDSGVIKTVKWWVKYDRNCVWAAVKNKILLCLLCININRV